VSGTNGKVSGTNGKVSGTNGKVSGTNGRVSGTEIFCSPVLGAFLAFHAKKPGFPFQFPPAASLNAYPAPVLNSSNSHFRKNLTTNEPHELHELVLWFPWFYSWLKKELLLAYSK
jgi:hypothetical protein